MKRQHVRKGILIASFALFPVSIFYFSPYLIVWGAFSGEFHDGHVAYSYFTETDLTTTDIDSLAVLVLECKDEVVEVRLFGTPLAWVLGIHIEA